MGEGAIEVTVVRGGAPSDDRTLVAIARALAELDERRAVAHGHDLVDTAWSSAGRTEAIEGRRVRTPDGVARPGRTG